MKRHPHFSLFHRSSLSVVPASVLGLCLTAFGCGSGGGSVADQPLVIPDISEVSAGDPTCAAGGVRVRLGVDDNRDGDLDDDEVDSTSYVCNGANMVDGADDVLVRTVALSLGDTQCPAGGRRVDVGLDNGDGTGLPGNDILENDEVDTSYLDCNGAVAVVVTPPVGTPGTATLDTHGGEGGTGVGGNAGNVREDASRQVMDSHLMIANTGSVNASCAVPGVTIDLGSEPVTIAANTTLSVATSEDEATLADGALFLRENDAGLYVWDDENGVGERATGLRVAGDVTLTLEHNTSSGAFGVTLDFSRDVEVLGTVTTAAANGQKGFLSIDGRQVRFAPTSSVDLRGSDTYTSGRLALDASQDLFALGSIDTSGHSGDSGGSGGEVDLEASGAVYTDGSIVTAGGDATGNTGGNGGTVEIEAATRMICNAADITTDGGDSAGVAGPGGSITFGDHCLYSYTVEIRNSGDLRTRGGDQVGDCEEVCDGGGGGNIDFIALQSGSVSSSGALDTRGGAAEDADGGDGGDINVRPGAFFESVSAVSLYQFSGTITTFGGDGSGRGGAGGNVVSYNQGALGSFTRFLGYADAILDGGNGSNGGGDGGDIDFQPDMESTTGGHGLYVFTNVTAKGGEASADNGGDGGTIRFAPELDFVVRGSAPAENVVIVGTVDLSGGDGEGQGGAGGSIYATYDCAPILSATGIRVEGTITLDGGHSGLSDGGRTGGLYLATARGAAVVAGTVHAVGGDGGNGQGGNFAASSVFGVPARVTADITAAGGEGFTRGGFADDIAILSVGIPSVVTGTITLMGGAGPTAADNGNTGLVRVDTGSSCVGP